MTCETIPMSTYGEKWPKKIWYKFNLSIFIFQSNIKRFHFIVNFIGVFEIGSFINGFVRIGEIILRRLRRTITTYDFLMSVFFFGRNGNRLSRRRISISRRVIIVGSRGRWWSIRVPRWIIVRTTRRWSPTINTTEVWFLFLQIFQVHIEKLMVTNATRWIRLTDFFLAVFWSRTSLEICMVFSSGFTSMNISFPTLDIFSWGTSRINASKEGYLKDW